MGDKKRSGNSMVELVMVMTLMILFGVTIFTLISAGSNAQEKINENKNAQVDARITLSYLNVKIKQNLEADSVEVAVCPLTGENALLIKTRGLDEYDTWVYFYDGVIYEFLGFAGDAPEVDLSFEVIQTRGFDITYDRASNCITNTITYDYAGELKTVSQTVNLRVSKR